LTDSHNFDKEFLKFLKTAAKYFGYLVVKDSDLISLAQWV